MHTSSNGAHPSARAASVARLTPVAVVLACAAAAAWVDRGSIRATEWLPYAIVAALAVAAALVSRSAHRPSRAALVGLAGLAGVAVLDALSALWSPLPSLARDEALLVALYALAFVLPSLTLGSSGDRLAATALVVCGAAATSAATGTLLAFGENATIVVDGRLAYPIPYSNAVAALGAVAFFPAVAIAIRDRAAPVARALALAGAAACLGQVVLTQSKGAVAGILLGLLVLLVVAPLRLRLLVPLAALFALGAAAYLPLTGPFRALETPDEPGAARTAGIALLLMTVAAFAAGWLYALADRRLDVGERTVRRIGFALATVAAGAAVVGAAAFLVVVGSPTAFVAEKWETFSVSPPVETGTSHLVNLGSNRADAWGVAWRAFEDHPIAGIGARGFRVEYEQHKESPENLARAHSLALDVLSETGVLGLALLALGVGVPLAAGLARGRRATGAAAIAAAATAWLAHAFVDWTWTFPAAGIPFFLLLGIAVAYEGRAAMPGRAAASGAAAAAAVAALAFAPTLVAGRLTDRALLGTGDVASDLRWARRLDPLSVAPLQIQARIAPTQEEALALLRRAAEMEPRNYATRFDLGRTYVAFGRIDEGRRELEAAARLAPHDPFVKFELERLDSTGS